MTIGTMKAVRFHAAKDVRVEEVPAPTIPKNDEILMKVFYCGICGTDVHEYVGGPSSCPSATCHPLTNEKVPVTLGHEFSGQVLALGPTVDQSKYRIGDKVTVEPLIVCGKCDACTNGESYLCPSRGFVGLDGLGGGLSEYVTLPQYMVHVLPENVSLEAGALIEPLAVAFHAVKKSKLGKDSKACIFGAGPIGILILKVLKARGVGWIAVAERAQRRAQMAKNTGADVVLDPVQEDIVKACMKASGGLGVDASFDCAGHETTINAAIKCIRRKGTVVNLAVWGDKPAPIQMTNFLREEKILTGAFSYDREDFPDVIQALSEGKLEAEQFITGRVDLQDAVEKGFNALIHEKDKHIKILISPTEYKT